MYQSRIFDFLIFWIFWGDFLAKYGILGQKRPKNRQKIKKSKIRLWYILRIPKRNNLAKFQEKIWFQRRVINDNSSICLVRGDFASNEIVLRWADNWGHTYNCLKEKIFKISNSSQGWMGNTEIWNEYPSQDYPSWPKWKKWKKYQKIIVFH